MHASAASIAEETASLSRASPPARKPKLSSKPKRNVFSPVVWYSSTFSPMNRKPVITFSSVTPYAAEIASARRVETMLLMTTPLSGSRFCRLMEERICSSRMQPIWFPVSVSHSSDRVFTAMPRRSASGSVARQTRAPFSSASAIARRNAFGSSGFGAVTVGKCPSGAVCSGTVITLVSPTRESSSRTGTAPVPCNGVYTIGRSPPLRRTRSGSNRSASLAA